MRFAGRLRRLEQRAAGGRSLAEELAHEMMDARIEAVRARVGEAAFRAAMSAVAAERGRGSR